MNILNTKPMHKPIVKHTINIFERIHVTLPPLVPKRIIHTMENAIEHLRVNYDLDVDDVECVMIIFGKKIWPYSRAFDELRAVYSGSMEEKLFMQKAPVSMKRKYANFCETGGEFSDLRGGSIAGFFSPEERVELHQLLVEIGADIREFARQAAVHSDKKAYMSHVGKYTEILEQIEGCLRDLRELAESEDHPQLAKEIKEHVKGFEHGFAMLGPGVRYEDVRNACDYLKGRKKDILMYE